LDQRFFWINLNPELKMKRKKGTERRTGIGHGDFVDLIGVKPDLASAALEHARGKPLLELQRHHRLAHFGNWRVFRERNLQRAFI
jgi:hypothetical protein